MDNFEDFINKMIEDGYCSEKDLAPLKCHHCNSKDLEDRNHIYEGSMIVGLDKYCNDCGKLVNNWEYGMWSI